MNGMSGVLVYFDVRHSCDGRVVSCTRVPIFTPMKIPWDSLPLEGGCTPGTLNSNRIGSLENFPRTLTCRATARPCEGRCLILCYSGTNINTYRLEKNIIYNCKTLM